MKIYMVCCSNGLAYEDYSWSAVKAFASKDAAMKYIQDMPELYEAARDRIHELNDKQRRTEDEQKELERLATEWWAYSGTSNCWIVEYEVQE